MELRKEEMDDFIGKFGQSRLCGDRALRLSVRRRPAPSKMQGSNPSAQLSEGPDLESVYRASRRDPSGTPRRRLSSRRHRSRRLWRRYRGGAYRGGVFYCGGASMVASTAAGTAVGLGRGGTAGAPAARSPPAPLSACSLLEPRRLTRDLRPRRDCAGITPIQATATASGTPANKLRPDLLTRAEASIPRPGREPVF